MLRKGRGVWDGESRRGAGGSERGEGSGSAAGSTYGYFIAGDSRAGNWRVACSGGHSSDG